LPDLDCMYFQQTRINSNSPMKRGAHRIGYGRFVDMNRLLLGFFSLASLQVGRAQSAPSASINGPSELSVGQSETWQCSATHGSGNLVRWRIYLANNALAKWTENIDPDAVALGGRANGPGQRAPGQRGQGDVC
jgi:hypothetical protein